MVEGAVQSNRAWDKVEYDDGHTVMERWQECEDPKTSREFRLL